MSKKRFAILGLGQFGRVVARELSQLGCEVLAVDLNEKLVTSLAADVTRACVADVRDRAALEEVITSRYDAAVIAMGQSLESTILATVHLRDLGVDEVWAEANADDRAEVLRRVGATRILAPERDSGRRVAAALASPNLIEFLPLKEDYGVVEVEAPEWTFGKTLAELNIRVRYHVAVIAIHAAAGEVKLVPAGDTRLQQGDVLTLVGRDEDLGKFNSGE